MAHNIPRRTLTLTVTAVALALSTGVRAASDFAPAKRLTTDDNPTAIATGDLNKDGIPDLVTANFTSGSVSILLGSAGGLGNFDLAINMEVGTGVSGTGGIAADRKPFGVAIGDLDGDTNPDIAVAVSGSDDIVIIKGNGAAGTFNPPDAITGHLPTGADPRSIALGDVDADGDLDIVVGNMNTTLAGTDSVTVRLNQLAQGSADVFNEAINSPFTSVGNQPFGVVVADATGDSIPDIVLTNFDANTVRILPGSNDGNFNDATETVVTVGGTATTKPYTVAVTELDGNAFPDLVVTNADTNAANNSVSVLLADGMGGFTKTDTTAGTSPRGLAVADVGGTSALDLIVANRDSNNVMVLEGDGTGAFPAVTNTFATLATPVPLVSADFDGDGIADAAVANAGVGSLDATVLINDNQPMAGNDAFNVINASSNVVLDVLANDSDTDSGDTLTITAAGPGDQGGTIDFSSGTNIVYTPAVSDATETFTYTVQDQFGYGATATVTVTIAPNQAPSFTSTAVMAATQDAAYTYNITTTDPDTGDSRVITAPTKPAWLSFTDNGNGTATLSGTPTNAEVGTHSVNLVVTDAGSLTGSQPFTITVANVNDAPSFTSTAVTAATEDVAYTYNITTTDPDTGDTLAITATTKPAWLTLTDNGNGTATLGGTPTNAEVGNHAVTLVVTDSGVGNLTANQSFTVAVANVNDPPVAVGSIAAQSGTEGTAFGPLDVSGNFSDPDSALVYSISGLPMGTGLSINTSTAVISGTPTDADAQASPISVSVSATDGSTPASQPFTLTVADINVAPSFTSTAVTAATEDSAYSYSITSTDTDAIDTLTITATTLPAWLTLTDNGDGTATLSGTPTNAEVGNHTVDLVVTDSGAGSLTDTQSFTVAVANVNDAPVVTSGGIILFQEATGTVQVNVSDVDAGDTFTYAVTQQPATVGGMPVTVDGSGLVSFDATGATAGADSIVVTVTDQGGTGIAVPVTIPLTVNATGETDTNGDGVTDAQATALGLDPAVVGGDTDGDGVSDANEIGDPASPADADNDGVIDALETGATATDASMASGLPFSTGDSVVITSTGQTLSGVAAATATGGPANVTFSFGTVSYTTTVTNPGDSATVRLAFSADLPASNLVVYKVNGGTFTELSTSVWTKVDARTIDVTLTDGDAATDLDGIANGSIDDPIAVGAAAAPPAPSSGGGGGGGCSLKADSHTATDPLMPLLLIAALGTLYRRRNRQALKASDAR